MSDPRGTRASPRRGRAHGVGARGREPEGRGGQDDDYVLIDCPPSLGLLTINALVAADRVLVPLQCEYYALEGLGSLLRTIDLVKGSLKPELEMEGVVLTMFDARNNLAHQVMKDVQKNLRGQVYETVIPRNVRLSEAPSHGRPAILYDIESKGAQSYLQLAEELVQRHRAAAVQLKHA